MSKFSGLAILAMCITFSMGQYQQIPGKQKYVTASVNYLWAIKPNEHLYRCDRPCTGKWVSYYRKFTYIDASDEEIWGVNANHSIFKRSVDGRYPYVGGSWQRIPGSLKRVSASGNGYIWGVNADDQIFKCKKPCEGSWTRVNGSLKQIDGGYKYVYGIRHDNTIWSRPVDGSGSWRQIPGSLKHITASGADDVFGTTTENEVWRCKKPCIGEWEKMSGSLRRCDATIDGLFGTDLQLRIFEHYIGA